MRIEVDEWGRCMLESLLTIKVDVRHLRQQRAVRIWEQEEEEGRERRKGGVLISKKSEAKRKRKRGLSGTMMMMMTQTQNRDKLTQSYQ